jgi:UDP-4-amino-4,6-dideoxy-N-acetyl-beta-L-altrosamine transaminase
VIPYGRQQVTQADIDVVSAVLAGDWLTTGPYVTAFEEQVAEYVGARYAIAFSSATAALHGAAHAAGLHAGDVVYTSPLTFIASANCARYVGAQPALIDIDPQTLNIDVSRVDESVQALIPVHYAGLPVELDKLPTRPRVIIEDASHALGAHTPDGPVGNCARSDMCVFSFHPVKPLTTGEGGMVTTNDLNLAQALRAFRSHGIDRTPTDEPWYYDAVELGYNYRLTDIQAALGSSQLRRLDSFITRRNEIAATYRDELADLPITLPPTAPEGYTHGYHLFAIQVANRGDVFRGLRDRGIGVQVHYVPVHHHGVSRDLEVPAEGYPAADAAYAGLISLPIYPGLSDEDQQQVVDALKAAVSAV